MPNRTRVKSLLKPPALRPGDRVGLVCPASRPATPAVVAHGQRVVEEMGFVPVVGRHVFATHGFSAGQVSHRLADLHEFFADDSIAAIFCLTGGYGNLHLLPFLDYQAIAGTPKLVAGCDDNTILLNALLARCGLVSLHAANLDQITRRSTFDRFKCAVTTSTVPAPLLALQGDLTAVSNPGFYCPVSGSADGRLVGGNLTALSSLLGTGFMPDVRGAILALEDLDEQNGILDRWFTSLYLSGDLQYASAVIFGSFVNCSERDSANMLSWMEVFADRLQYLSKVSCFGMPFGQQEETHPLPLGITAAVDAGSGRLEFLENAFER